MMTVFYFDPSKLTLHELFDIAAAVVLISSLAYSFLPPWEWFDKWPNFQAIYKIFTMTIARWGAINLRREAYPQTKIENQIDKAISGPIKTVQGNNP